MTCRQIGNFLGFKEKQIQKRASHLGVASKRRKYNLEFFDELKSKLWGGHLWDPSYYVATVSENTESQIRQYIQNQKER